METNCTIRWWEIYPVNSAIHLLNNRGLQYFFLHGRVRACRPGMHALQVKNKRYNPGLGRYVL